MAIQQQPLNENEQADDVIRIMDLLYLCLAKWPWFIISVTICLGAAMCYLLKTEPVYTRSADILVKDDSKGKPTSGEMDVFSDMGLFTGTSNVNDEMGTLQSPHLMREVVARLNLESDYQIPGYFRRTTVYGDSLPIKVALIGFAERAATSFTIEISEKGDVTLSDFTLNHEDMDADDITFALGDTVMTPIGLLAINRGPAYNGKEEQTVYFDRTSRKEATIRYSKKLEVTHANDKSNIITLTVNDVSTVRAEDVLNTLIAVYNENWVRDKNRIAVSTSMFINDRLGVIEGELGNVDDDISSYKSEHLLPDVQAAASMYMAQANEANANIQALNNQVYMARYIRNYLANEANRNQLLPANSGLESSDIASQISEYNDLVMERKSLVAHSSERNPLVQEMDATLRELRSALILSIDNQMVALEAQIKSQQNMGGLATSRIASNPQQSKYLLSVERQQKVKESLYLFLLQKREENELSQAFTAYNTRIITPPDGSDIPTAPVTRNIIIIAFVIGLAIPVGIVFLRENMNTVVRGRKDVETLSLPFIGEIPQCTPRRRRGLINRWRKPVEVKAIVVRKGSRNIINEAFRVLRTNLEFMIGKDRKTSVIVMTSFNPGSGKSFLTMNVAMSLAIKDKDVLVIDGDMRHGSSSAYVGSPDHGMSDYLSGQTDDIDSLIVNDEHNPHLHVLPVGMLPPNPAELLGDDRFGTLIDAVREKFDIVLIDCPPIELVADTQIIEKHADRTIFVVRAGLLERAMLPELERIYTEKKFKNMALVLNGTQSSGNRYGYKYGYKYGYHYGYGYGYHYGSKDDKTGGGKWLANS